MSVFLPPEQQFAAEREMLWRALRDLRAATRDGDVPHIVEECLDEVEIVYTNTDFRLLRERAGEVLAELRPSVLRAAAR